jgi:hypothetical protein
MVFQYSQYTTDEFARQFVQSYKFVWPDSQQSAYAKVPNTPLYIFTEEFLACSNDIKRYRMDSDFLAMYPAFYGDCPVTGSIPMELQTSSYSCDCEWTIHGDTGEQDQRNSRIPTI